MITAQCAADGGLLLVINAVNLLAGATLAVCAHHVLMLASRMEISTRCGLALLLAVPAGMAVSSWWRADGDVLTASLVLSLAPFAAWAVLTRAGRARVGLDGWGITDHSPPDFEPARHVDLDLTQPLDSRRR